MLRGSLNKTFPSIQMDINDKFSNIERIALLNSEIMRKSSMFIFYVVYLLWVDELLPFLTT